MNESEKQDNTRDLDRPLAPKCNQRAHGLHALTSASRWAPASRFCLPLEIYG
ncbi:hypothetical protein PanWU01x14_152380, partial [Parasponia andersonii]